MARLRSWVLKISALRNQDSRSVKRAVVANSSLLC